MNLSNKTINEAFDKKDLLLQLQQFGIKKGMCLEVHCALSTVGFVLGGAETVLDSLIEAVGPEGTIVMPTQCRNNTEPYNWVNPPVEIALIDKIRNGLPGYDIYNSDIHTMGALAECLRNRHDAAHSYHPNEAFCAIGQNAKELMKNQPLSFALAAKSPLDKMYGIEDSYILLIGVTYHNATGMHLGECNSKVRNIVINGGAVKKGNETIWKKFLDYDLDSEEFEEVGKILEANKQVKIGKLGNSVIRLVKFKTAVDYTYNYLIKKYGG